MKTLALYNLKGGVGKTAAAVNLAYLAAQDGIRTLLWDLDAQGAAGWYLGLEPTGTLKGGRLIRGRQPLGDLIRDSGYERLDVIAADRVFHDMDATLARREADVDRLASLLAPCAEVYALTLLDCPPSLSRLADNVFAAADMILMPLIPSPLSLRAYAQVRDHLKGLGAHKRLRPFFSMVDRRRRLQRTTVEEPDGIRRLLATEIPSSAVIERMGERRAPVETYAAWEPAAAAYRSLWAEVRALLRP